MSSMEENFLISITLCFKALMSKIKDYDFRRTNSEADNGNKFDDN